MTTVAAYLDSSGNIGIGSDHAVTSNIKNIIKRSGKIWNLGSILVGFAGMVPPHQIRTKKYSATISGCQKLARDFRKVFNELGHGGSTEDGVKVVPFSAVVIGHKLPPVLISEYFEPIELETPYIAIGSGSNLATGALHLSATIEMPVEQALTAALNAAIEHDPFSGGEPLIYVVEAPAKEKKTRRSK